MAGFEITQMWKEGQLIMKFIILAFWITNMQNISSQLLIISVDKSEY